MRYENLVCTREDDFAVITMSRPERRNALSQSHLCELQYAFDAAGKSDARGVILAAKGPVFCAGHDFADMHGRDERRMRELLDVCGELMQTIQHIPQPVIAQVEGLATAAGCQLVATCDLAVASTEARFAVPGGKGGWFCSTPGVAIGRNLSRKHAMEMLLTGEMIDAAEAHRLGLVNRVVPQDKVMEEARSLLATILERGPLAVRYTLEATHQGLELPMEDGLRLEANLFAVAFATEDKAEGTRAFLEKRAPAFRGK